jgi:hypothetical protein
MADAPLPRIGCPDAVTPSCHVDDRGFYLRARNRRSVPIQKYLQEPDHLSREAIPPELLKTGMVTRESLTSTLWLAALGMGFSLPATN